MGSTRTARVVKVKGTNGVKRGVRGAHERITRQVLQMSSPLRILGYLGPGEGTGVATGTSAGDASSGEGALGSESSSSEVSGDGVGEAFTSSGDALDGEGASGGVELELLGKISSISCLRTD